MRQMRQKVPDRSRREREADEIARSFARFAPVEDRPSWLGPAAVTAAVALSLAGVAFVFTGSLSGNAPVSRPEAPEVHATLEAAPRPMDASALARSAPPRDAAREAEVRLPRFAARSTDSGTARPAPAGELSAGTDAALPPPAVAVTVTEGVPAVVPPPRPARVTVAAASVPPRLRPQPRPADPTGIVATRASTDLAVASAMAARSAPKAMLAAAPRPRLRPDAVVARASMDMASLTGTVMTRRDPILGAAGCGARLAAGIPDRRRGAAPGSALAARMEGMGGADRDALIERELLAGNMPSFLRALTPVTIRGRLPDGRRAEVTVCVMPDYLALGDDRDHLRVPMGLPAAARVAGRFGFLLPTTRMVDAIHAQAGLRLAPQPMTPGAAMTSTRYFAQHNRTVEGQTRGRSGVLTAGQKKDLVLTNRLWRNPGRVAIYGWHHPDGTPIQPLSTVHGARYADYSHGVRLVSQTAFVNGRAVALAALLENPAYAAILTGEGPIEAPERLMASLSR